MNGIVLSLAILATGQPQINLPATHGVAVTSTGSRIIVPVVNGQYPTIIDTYDCCGRIIDRRLVYDNKAKISAPPRNPLLERRRLTMPDSTVVPKSNPLLERRSAPAATGSTIVPKTAPAPVKKPEPLKPIPLPSTKDV